MSEFSILVNTCDKFEDCWNPFFTLFRRYWPDCSAKIYLNTEYKEFSFPDINIISVRGCQDKPLSNKTATWSQCLRWALERIDSEIVLYLQEDYFFKSSVNNTVVESYVQLMTDNPEIKCLHLTDQACIADEDSSFVGLRVVNRKQRYRVSCQAALWRKEELLSLIRDYESAWEFEEFGSKRSAKINNLYLAVNPNIVKLDIYEIIPYVFTGIVQGKWLYECVNLFAENGIDVDFSKRGFHQDDEHRPIIKRITYHIHKLSHRIRNW